MAYPEPARCRQLTFEGKLQMPRLSLASVFSRAGMVAAAMILVGLLLAGRLVQLHLTNGSEFERLATRQRIFREVVPARPGEIVDRHGHVFATSVGVRSVYVVPRELRDGWSVARQLAGAARPRRRQIVRAYRRRAPDAASSCWIKRRISDEEAERVRALKLSSGTMGFPRGFLRDYPQGTIAAQSHRSARHRRPPVRGIEQSLDGLLRGRDGSRLNWCRMPAGQHVFEKIRDDSATPPHHGQTVVLSTLDAVIQGLCRTRPSTTSSKKAGTPGNVGQPPSILDPQTGDILAMASRPKFDPKPIPEQASADAHWKNRPIADIYERVRLSNRSSLPGAWAQGCLRSDDVFPIAKTANTTWPAASCTITTNMDASPIVDILVKSSNIGMAKIGEADGKRTALSRRRPCSGSGVAPESNCREGSPIGYAKLNKWNAYSTGSVPMGQEIAATPLQIIAACMARLANGGTLKTPRLVVREQADENSAGSGIVSPLRHPSGRWPTGFAARPWPPSSAARTGKKAAISGYEILQT